MDLIKRKIFLEDAISRNSDTTYGLMTASTFYVDIMLTQTIDNMGVFTDIPYYNIHQPDYSILINKMNTSGFTFPFMSGQQPPSVILTGFTACTRIDFADVAEWYADGDKIISYTESRLNSLKSYNKLNPYIIGFDLEAGNYTNYDNQIINGVSRVTSNTPKRYVFDGNDDALLGTTGQTTGLLFEDDVYGETEVGVGQAKGFLKPLKGISSVQHKAEGWNNTNVSLDAITKEEYLMGIINEPEVFSDVFIDRGATTVMEKHLKLSEVESLEHLQNFGNGFYNIVKI